jgi:hypothetical protein
VIADEVLTALTPSERADVVHRIELLTAEQVVLPRRIRIARRWTPRFLALCCLILIPWIGYLFATLPQRYESANWTLTWTGLDVAELVALAVTAWSLWRQRQVAVTATLVTAVLLGCDAWFDVTTAQPGADLLSSVTSAILIELPLAAALLALHIRLGRVSTRLTHGLPLRAHVASSWNQPLATAAIHPTRGCQLDRS